MDKPSVTQERSDLIAWLRGELVGPTEFLAEPDEVIFNDKKSYDEHTPDRRGPLTWRPTADDELQEVLYYRQESPQRKYGAGLLFPSSYSRRDHHDGTTISTEDNIGFVPEQQDFENNLLFTEQSTDDSGQSNNFETHEEPSQDFEISETDKRQTSVIGISFCASFEPDGALIIEIPQSRRFPWQGRENASGKPFQLNGRYERCHRTFPPQPANRTAMRPEPTTKTETKPAWRRQPTALKGNSTSIPFSALTPGKPMTKLVEMPDDSPVQLELIVFPRRIPEMNGQDHLLVTVALRNVSDTRLHSAPETILYQACFEVRVTQGRLLEYPESHRRIEDVDDDEQTLRLLYRDAATYGIGHGCAAAWDTPAGTEPPSIYADVMPTVETPSTTPDIRDADDKPIELSMRDLASLPDDHSAKAWTPLHSLVTSYEDWINSTEADIPNLESRFHPVATRHLAGTRECLRRIKTGVALLESDLQARRAFRFANLSMFLQQIATKQFDKRDLRWNSDQGIVLPEGETPIPWDYYISNTTNTDLGKWRAFQIAFILMSLEGLVTEGSPDRDIVDLIWFPTGGGKTEAYLGVMAFYMFYQRLLMQRDDALKRDGTNVLMRYTLRMLTTQQFQRAASLVCAMEFIRRNPVNHPDLGTIPGRRFSLGMWIGAGGSPNKIESAREELKAFRKRNHAGNPLVLTECPWCRAEIGKSRETKPRDLSTPEWNQARVAGIIDVQDEGPLLVCPDPSCLFGRQDPSTWLPIEVIDERLYQHPPSMVIGTVDKFALVAYRPDAGALFGRHADGMERTQSHRPPGMIVQDELHLIAGPLGTVYGLYETVFEQLCTYEPDGECIKPKLIASTATIRGANEQVKALYARDRVQLFPNPGVTMGDSFFGQYATDRSDGSLKPGRLYLGIHSPSYGSMLTTQVRAFSSILFRPALFAEDPEKRDPWWTLLSFYNSLRELAGATTLFSTDIRTRLNFLMQREGLTKGQRRTLKGHTELTSRLSSQSQLVDIMDQLSNKYATNDNPALDACLASNIIEVGVDIDRLSLMAVTGQPKTTAQYIQVTGRVGRRWWERPGLILTLYNANKSRDHSHFEHFSSYHRRLYERVEPTSATPFAISAIRRALAGVLLLWARQHSDAPVKQVTDYRPAVNHACQLLRERCERIQIEEDRERSLAELESVTKELLRKWEEHPPEYWEQFPPVPGNEYLMLWPGQFFDQSQKQWGMQVPSSMRQVDGSAELKIFPLLRTTTP